MPVQVRMYGRLPLFLLLTIEVTPFCQHSSSIHQDDL